MSTLPWERFRIASDLRYLHPLQLPLVKLQAEARAVGNVQVAVFEMKRFGEDLMQRACEPAVDEFFSLGYVPEIDYFIDCILNDKPPKFGVDGAAGLASLEIVEAFYRSAAEGRAISIVQGSKFKV